MIFDICVVASVIVKNVNMILNFLSSAVESTREDSSSLVAELQEKLQEEKAKFLEQLEEQEKRKNEEMQNVRTSLIAEQQVCTCPHFIYSTSRR
jgi:glycerate-2-kinase